MSNHTPTPWEAVYDTYRLEKGKIHVQGITGWDDAAICVCDFADSQAVREADAALIVRAVNAHAGLVDALQRMLDAHDADVAHGSMTALGNTAAADMARAALAKATA